MKVKNNMDEAAAEREFLIRNQAHLDQQLLLGQAEHHCTEVKQVLTEQAQLHVKKLRMS